MLRDAYSDNIFSLCLPGNTVIGRAKTCDIVINHASVSKKHAVISLLQDEDESIVEAWIEDMSSIGTFVGLQGQEKRILKKTPLGFGNYIRFGNMTSGYFFENISQNTRYSQEELNLTDHSGARVPLELSPEPPNYTDEYQQPRGSSYNPGNEGFTQRQHDTYESRGRATNPVDQWRASGGQRPNGSSPLNSIESNRYSEYDDNRRYRQSGDQSNMMSSDEGIPWNFEQPVPHFDRYNDPSRSSHIQEESPLHGEHLHTRDSFPAPKLSSSLQLPPHASTRDSGTSHGNYKSGYEGGHRNMESSLEHLQQPHIINTISPQGPPRVARSDSGPFPNRVENIAQQVRHSVGIIGTLGTGGKYPNSVVDTDSMVPTGLSPAERAEIERSRGELAEGVRMANKALGGVIEFSDWKEHASRILASASAGSASAGQVSVSDAKSQEENIKTDQQLRHLDDAYIGSLITPEVISTCRDESSLPIQNTSLGALMKVETNLIFLLEYENDMSPAPCTSTAAASRTHALSEEKFGNILAQSNSRSQAISGAAGDKTNSQKAAMSRSQPSIGGGGRIVATGVFDTALYNGVLANTLRLLSDIVLRNDFIDAVDRSAAALHKQAIVKAHRQLSTKGLSTSQEIDIGECFSIRSIIESSVAAKLQGLIVFNNSMLKSNKTIQEVLDSSQMEKVNRHILSNVIEEDISPILKLLDEVKCRVTGDKKNDSRSKSTKIKFDMQSDGSGVNEPSKGKGKKISTETEHIEDTDLDVSLESLSAEFAEGELKLSSSDAGRRIRHRQNQDASIKPTRKRSPNKDGGVGISKDLWNRLDSKEDHPLEGTPVGSMGTVKGSTTSPIETSDGVTQKASTNLWNNSEYRDKSTAVRMMVRFDRRLMRRHMQRSFHRWIVFVQTILTSANLVKQIIPFERQPSVASLQGGDESVVSAYSENVTQSEEYLKLQEEREQLAREKEAKETQLQEMTQQFDNMLRRNSLLQEQGIQASMEMKTKLRVLKLMTSYSDNIRLKVKKMFFHWSRVTHKMRHKETFSDTRKKQLRRILRLRFNNSLTRRLIHKAFRTWETKCIRQYERIMGDSNSEKSVRVLRNEVMELKEQLLQVCTSDEAAASLVAERALNRELLAVNIDLQQRLSDLQTTLLEVAKVPVSDRKQIVREVLLDRENEVSKSRREVRSLREQIGRLELALRNPDNVVPQTEEGIKYKGNKQTKGKDNSLTNKSTSQQIRSTKGRKYASQNDSDSDDDKTSYDRGSGRMSEYARWNEPDRNEERQLSKQEAMRIVVSELRTLQHKCEDLKLDKIRLGQQILEETTRYQQQSMAFRVLQQRLMDRERSYDRLHKALIGKFGEGEVLKLLTGLDEYA